VQIFPFENAGDLQDRLMKQGALLVIKTLANIMENKIKVLPQTKLIDQHKPLKLAPKIHPGDCIINWNNKTLKVHNLVRGLAPYPCSKSWFRSDSTTISFKIFESYPEIEEHSFKPGTIFSDEKNYIRICCKDGFLSISSLQLEGKKRMTTVEFLRGFKIKNVTIMANQQV
jgi:methionyl-tRNA formyltransferase